MFSLAHFDKDDNQTPSLPTYTSVYLASIEHSSNLNLKSLTADLTNYQKELTFQSNFHGFSGNEQFTTAEYKYFLSNKKLMRLVDDQIILIDEGPWTKISGYTYADAYTYVSGAHSVAFGIKNNKLYLIDGESITEFGSKFTTDAIIDVLGYCSSKYDIYYGMPVALCITDKKEVFMIRSGLEIITSIHKFDESAIINQFDGLYENSFYPIIIVDNKAYTLSPLSSDSIKLTPILSDLNFIKRFNSGYGYIGTGAYGMLLSEDRQLWPVDNNYTPGSIITSVESDKNKWQFENGYYVSTHGTGSDYCVLGICNNKLYVIEAEDMDYPRPLIYARVIDDTGKWTWCSDIMYHNNNGAYYLALKDNKLYKIRVKVTYIYVPDSPEEYEFEVTELNYDGISNIENIVQVDTNYFIFYII